MVEESVYLHDRADLSTLGRLLRDRRRGLALTQEALADLAGVAVRLVHEVEHGKPTVRADRLLKLLDALGLVAEVRVRRSTDSPASQDGT